MESNLGLPLTWASLEEGEGLEWSWRDEDALEENVRSETEASTSWAKHTVQPQQDSDWSHLVLQIHLSISQL